MPCACGLGRSVAGILRSSRGDGYQVLFSGEVSQHVNLDLVREKLARELSIEERKSRQEKGWLALLDVNLIFVLA